MEHIVIVGGGGTGGALAYDLALRGFKVSLFDKGEILSGTTGRHHGLLHSGARYAVNDPAAARDCIEENAILRRLVPDAIEQNGGLFVALDDVDMKYRKRFIAGCGEVGIPIKELKATEALSLEPALSGTVKAAFLVPDAVMDAWRLPLHFFASARANGAEIHPFCPVIGVNIRNRRVTGVRVRDLRKMVEVDVDADIVVNASGAWSGRVASQAGVNVPVRPGPGIMVSVASRLTEMVINRLHPAGEGDIIVPQRRCSILGTSLWLADDPDDTAVPEGQIAMMFTLCGDMLPSVRNMPVHSVWCAPRPLINDPEAEAPQDISRVFECYDHAARDGLEGFLSLIGGKATTLRAMAERAADVICKKTGRSMPCRTAETPLVRWQAYYGKVIYD